MLRTLLLTASETQNECPAQESEGPSFESQARHSHGSLNLSSFRFCVSKMGEEVSSKPRFWITVDPPSVAATQVRRAGLPRRHKVTLPGTRAAGAQRNKQAVCGAIRLHSYGSGKNRHTPKGLGVKPGTSPHFLLNLLPRLMQMACPPINKALPP